MSCIIWWKAIPALRPCLSHHINSSKYDGSCSAWHPLIRFSFGVKCCSWNHCNGKGERCKNSTLKVEIITLIFAVYNQVSECQLLAMGSYPPLVHRKTIPFNAVTDPSGDHNMHWELNNLWYYTIAGKINVSGIRDIIYNITEPCHKESWPSRTLQCHWTPVGVLYFNIRSCWSNLEHWGCSDLL